MQDEREAAARAAWAEVERAFAAAPRPAIFGNPAHCCECAEHEATLAAATRESIGLAELGNPGWDPICFVRDEGYLYYFPATARLALGRGEAFYLDQFLFHLNPWRQALFTPSQRRAVLEYLWALLPYHEEELQGCELTLHQLGLRIDQLTALEGGESPGSLDPAAP